MKKILALILAAILLLALVSCKKEEVVDDSGIEDVANYTYYTDATTGDKLYYEVDELGGYSITKFETAESVAHKVVIPAEIENVEVTGVAKNAFLGCSYISEVEIPESVEYIGDYAFAGCIYLTKVTMTDSVTALGIGMFKDCVALTEVKFTSSAKILPAFTFENCQALTVACFPAGVTEIGEGAFHGAGLSEVVIPDTVTTIGDGAFINSSNTMKATIPATVTSIGNTVFRSSTSFTSEDEVETIVVVTIVGAEGSEAAKYAEEYGYDFEILA